MGTGGVSCYWQLFTSATKTSRSPRHLPFTYSDTTSITSAIQEYRVPHRDTSIRRLPHAKPSCALPRFLSFLRLRDVQGPQVAGALAARAAKGLQPASCFHLLSFHHRFGANSTLGYRAIPSLQFLRIITTSHLSFPPGSRQCPRTRQIHQPACQSRTINRNRHHVERFLSLLQGAFAHCQGDSVWSLLPGGNQAHECGSRGIPGNNGK